MRKFFTYMIIWPIFWSSQNAHSMEKKIEPFPNQRRALVEKTLAQSTPVDLTKSTIQDRIQAMENSPTFETPSWGITKTINYFRDQTTIALETVSGLNGKPEKPIHVGQRIDNGINDTLKKIHDIRQYNKPNKKNVNVYKDPENPTKEELAERLRITSHNRTVESDSLLKTLREQQPHSKNLETMITGAKNNNVRISEDALARASAHLEKARLEALVYQTHALKETQEYLQADKARRVFIYEKATLDPDALRVPSEDEYNDESLCYHYMNATQATTSTESGQ